MTSNKENAVVKNPTTAYEFQNKYSPNIQEKQSPAVENKLGSDRMAADDAMPP